MSTVQEIEDAIRRLPPAQLTSLRAWFADFDAALWDQQIDDDVRSGKLDALAEQALKDFEQGRCTEF